MARTSPVRLPVCGGYNRRGKTGTYRKKRSVLNKLREYHGDRVGGRLEFEDLTVRYLMD